MRRLMGLAEDVVDDWAAARAPGGTYFLGAVFSFFSSGSGVGSATTGGAVTHTHTPVSQFDTLGMNRPKSWDFCLPATGW